MPGYAPRELEVPWPLMLKILLLLELDRAAVARARERRLSIWYRCIFSLDLCIFRTALS